jgi:predicted kinase
LGPEAYREDVSLKVYDTLISRAKTLVDAGHAVIVDAVYLDRRDRVRVEQIATDAGVPFKGFWLTAPSATLRDRVRGRRHDASDATESVLEAQLEVDPGSMSWQTLDARPAPDAIAASARRVLGP